MHTEAPNEPAYDHLPAPAKGDGADGDGGVLLGQGHLTTAEKDLPLALGNVRIR